MLNLVTDTEIYYDLITKYHDKLYMVEKNGRKDDTGILSEISYWKQYLCTMSRILHFRGFNISVYELKFIFAILMPEGFHILSTCTLQNGCPFFVILNVLLS